MDVRLSPEQLALGQAAARLARDRGPGTVSGLGDDERIAKLDAAVEAAGWRQLRSAGADGRPWASGVEAALVAEELARGLADTAFLGPTLAAELRRCAGAPASEVPETVVLAADLQRLGRSVAVDAGGARRALALDGDRVVTLEVGARAPGPDLTRSCAAVGPPGETVGVVSADDLDRWTALGLSLTCADLVGTMRGAIELSVAYVTQRHQFGVPVGSFQAVQHLLADAHVSMEGSRSISLHAAWSVDALPPGEALAAAAAAKAYCARAARTTGEAAVQVHGGVGNTWENLTHVFLRRAIFSADLLGGVGPNLGRVLAHRGIGDDGGLR